MFLIGKNVSILRVLISINTVYYKRSYDLLKLNVKTTFLHQPNITFSFTYKINILIKFNFVTFCSNMK